MRPQVDPARRCLPVCDWPEADRAAWYAARSSDDPLSFHSTISSNTRRNLRLIIRTGAATDVGLRF